MECCEWQGVPTAHHEQLAPRALFASRDAPQTDDSEEVDLESDDSESGISESDDSDSEDMDDDESESEDAESDDSKDDTYNNQLAQEFEKDYTADQLDIISEAKLKHHGDCVFYNSMSSKRKQLMVTHWAKMD